MRSPLLLVWALLALALGTVTLVTGAFPWAGLTDRWGTIPARGISAPGGEPAAGGRRPADASLPDAALGDPRGSASDVETGRSGDGALPPLPAQVPVREPGLIPPLSPIRVPRPIVPPGPRRVGLQAGHWQTELVPEELRRLEHATGASGGGVAEAKVNLDIANRVVALLRAHGYHVDVLPTTVPTNYLADVFLSLHADGSADPGMRGFKAAHGSRRGPYEGQLVQAVVEEYGRATGLPVDPIVSRNMRGYYAFSWSRFQSSVAPHTPAAILEMGFLSNAADRSLLLGRPDVVATGVANGVLRFLHEVPEGAPFAEDLVVAPFIPFRPAPTPTPR